MRKMLCAAQQAVCVVVCTAASPVCKEPSLSGTELSTNVHAATVPWFQRLLQRQIARLRKRYTRVVNYATAVAAGVAGRGKGR